MEPIKGSVFGIIGACFVVILVVVQFSFSPAYKQQAKVITAQLTDQKVVDLILAKMGEKQTQISEATSLGPVRKYIFHIGERTYLALCEGSEDESWCNVYRHSGFAHSNSLK